MIVRGYIPRRMSEERISDSGKDTTVKCGLLLIDDRGRILLQLRDDKSDIPFPNRWGTFGGAIEPGETPEQAIVRELEEELGYELTNFSYLGNFPYDGYEIHMYCKTDPDLRLADLSVKEGQRAEFLSLEEVRQVDCAFNCREIVEFYFSREDG
jgi:8-oxo-dGTP diphosphatase